MRTFLVFLKNTATDEEFVAPVNGVSRAGALAMAVRRYPAPRFEALTCYEDAEMRRILADVQRWPGMVSNPQAAGVAAAMVPVAKAVPVAASGQSLQEQQAAVMARLAMTRMQVRRESGVQAAPALPATVAAPMPVAAPLPKTPVPQDLKSALALLRQSGAVVQGVVEKTRAAAVTVPVVESVPVAVEPPVISRRPVAAVEQPPAPRSVVDVFKALRK